MNGTNLNSLATLSYLVALLLCGVLMFEPQGFCHDSQTERQIQWLEKMEASPLFNEDFDDDEIPSIKALLNQSLQTEFGKLTSAVFNDEILTQRFKKIGWKLFDYAVLMVKDHAHLADNMVRSGGKILMHFRSVFTSSDYEKITELFLLTKTSSQIEKAFSSRSHFGQSMAKPQLFALATPHEADGVNRFDEWMRILAAPTEEQLKELIPIMQAFLKFANVASGKGNVLGGEGRCEALAERYFDLATRYPDLVPLETLPAAFFTKKMIRNMFNLYQDSEQEPSLHAHIRKTALGLLHGRVLTMKAQVILFFGEDKLNDFQAESVARANNDEIPNEMEDVIVGLKKVFTTKLQRSSRTKIDHAVQMIRSQMSSTSTAETRKKLVDFANWVLASHEIMHSHQVAQLALDILRHFKVESIETVNLLIAYSKHDIKRSKSIISALDTIDLKKILDNEGNSSSAQLMKVTLRDLTAPELPPSLRKSRYSALIAKHGLEAYLNDSAATTVMNDCELTLN